MILAVEEPHLSGWHTTTFPMRTRALPSLASFGLHPKPPQQIPSGSPCLHLHLSATFSSFVDSFIQNRSMDSLWPWPKVPAVRGSVLAIARAESGLSLQAQVECVQYVLAGW